MAIRLATSLAIAAIMLRVLLPALHTHGHHHHTSASSNGSLATACSCGALHPSEGPERDHEYVASSTAGHHCLACEIDSGIPCDCPPCSDWSTAENQATEYSGLNAREILVDNQVGLPQPRAPPIQRT
jgi:hypothetical protein